MYYPSQDGYREGGSPLSSVPPTQYIPGLGVEKGGANRIADTICPVCPGSRPNCAGSCGGGCTIGVKMGTGRVVPPTHRRPPPNISQDWGSEKGERTESPTRCVLCARGRAPTVQDLVVEDVLPRSRWVQGGWFPPLIGAPHPIHPRIGGRKRGSEQNRRHDVSCAPGVAPQLCRIL